MDGLLSTLIPAGLISYTRPTAGMFCASLAPSLAFLHAGC